MNVVPIPAFQDNYIWVIRRGNAAAVVDPGDAEPVLAYLAREQLRLVAILNTHHHADHVGGNAALLAQHPAPVFGPAEHRIPEITHAVVHGARVELPEVNVAFEVIGVPGHTRSHIAFHGAGMLFCGDTLFACGCGRLFEGTPQQMYASLSRLAALPGDTHVYCGHEYTLANIRFARAVEPANHALAAIETRCQALRDRSEPTVPSIMADERAANPFLRCNESAVVAAASRFTGRTLDNPAEVLGAMREWKNNF